MSSESSFLGKCVFIYVAMTVSEMLVQQKETKTPCTKRLAWIKKQDILFWIWGTIFLVISLFIAISNHFINPEALKSQQLQAPVLQLTFQLHIPKSLDIKAGEGHTLGRDGIKTTLTKTAQNQSDDAGALALYQLWPLPLQFWLGHISLQLNQGLAVLPHCFNAYLSKLQTIADAKDRFFFF